MSHNGIVNQYADLIGVLEDGQLAADLSKRLQGISEALSAHVLEHGGTPKATLSLKLEFKAEKGVIEIAAKVDQALPKAPRLRSIMWQTPDNRLTVQNPRQMRMFDDPQVIDGEAVRNG